MNKRTKLEYLGVLLNIKKGIYLKEDLIIVKRMLELESEKNNEQLKMLEKGLSRQLVKTA